MHAEAMAFVRHCLEVEGVPTKGARVLDVGAYDVNGSPRSLLVEGDALAYVGLDVRHGPGVDVVADLRYWMPRAPFDIILCLETLEHVPGGETYVDMFKDCARPGTWLILTCAIDPRKPHSANGRPQVPADEHYGNVNPYALRKVLIEGGWRIEKTVIDAKRGDLFLLARMPA